MEKSAQASLHPMIRFKVVGYRTEAIDNAIAQSKAQPVTPEARREYHIGLIYDHKPKYEGVLYEVIYDIGAYLSPEYLEHMWASPYKDHLNFNVFQVIDCPICNPLRSYELVDERKAPNA